MDKSTTLYTITAAGSLYTAHMLLAPRFYLSQAKIDENFDTIALFRGLGGGIIGLTSMAYMAAKSSSEELKLAALCSGATAFVAWTVNNAYITYTKASLQAKSDLACSAFCLGICTCALAAGK